MSTRLAGTRLGSGGRTGGKKKLLSLVPGQVLGCYKLAWIYSSLFELSIPLAKDFSFVFVFPTKHRKNLFYFQLGHSKICFQVSAWVTTYKTNMRQGTRCNDVTSGYYSNQSFTREFRSKPLKLRSIFGSDVIRPVPRAVSLEELLKWGRSWWNGRYQYDRMYEERTCYMAQSVSPKGACTICLWNGCNFMVNVLYFVCFIYSGIWLIREEEEHWTANSKSIKIAENTTSQEKDDNLPKVHAHI